MKINEYHVFTACLYLHDSHVYTIFMPLHQQQIYIHTHYCFYLKVALETARVIQFQSKLILLQEFVSRLSVLPFSGHREGKNRQPGNEVATARLPPKMSSRNILFRDLLS